MSSPKPIGNEGYWPAFTPEVGATPITAYTITTTPQTAAAIPIGDATAVPRLLHVRGAGPIRFAFLTAAQAAAAVTVDATRGWKLGFGTVAAEFTTEFNIPTNATHISMVSLTGANVAVEVAVSG